MQGAPDSSRILRRHLGGRGGDVRFSFQMQPGGRAIAMGFTRWANLVEDWRVPFRAIVRMLRIHAERHYQSQGTYTGARFLPLLEPYKSRKARTHPNAPILTREGHMRRAFTTPGAPGSMARVSRDSMVYGIDPNARRPGDGRRFHTVAMAHARGIPSRMGPRVRPPFRYEAQFGQGQGGARQATVGAGMRDILAQWVVYHRQVALHEAAKRSGADMSSRRVAQPNMQRTLARMNRIAQARRR